MSDELMSEFPALPIMGKMAFDSHKVKIKKFQVSLHFKLFKKSKKTFPLLAQAPKTFKNKICWSILGLLSTFSEALRNAHLINMQNFKVKFWNWGPLKFLDNITSVHVF